MRWNRFNANDAGPRELHGREAPPLRDFETLDPRLRLGCHCAYTMSNLFSKPVQIMQIVRVDLIELAGGEWQPTARQERVA